MEFRKAVSGHLGLVSGTFRRSNHGFFPTFTQAIERQTYDQPFPGVESRGRQGNRPCLSANGLPFPEMS